jgi:acyl-coenzyme A thioesterase PaaI-like protein
MPSRDKIERQLTDKCFGCGQQNPMGLKLRFRTEGNSVKADFIPASPYEGYPGYLLGGITCAILDEAMGWAAYGLSSGALAITAKAEIKFRRPLLIGEPLIVAASITRRSTRHLWTEATIKRKDGKLAAEASAIMVISDSE